MKKIIENQNGSLIFNIGAARTCEFHLNMLKHEFLNKTTWEPEDFEDETNEGILNLIHSFLTSHGKAPKRIEGAGKSDIECKINGVWLFIVALATPLEERETVYRYDKEKLIQEDGGICFIADSAESWLIFYEQFFGEDDGNDFED